MSEEHEPRLEELLDVALMTMRISCLTGVTAEETDLIRKLQMRRNRSRIYITADDLFLLPNSRSLQIFQLQSLPAAIGAAIDSIHR